MKTFYCSHCGVLNHVEFELGEPLKFPEKSKFPEKVSNPLILTNSSSWQTYGWELELGFNPQNSYLQRGVSQILLYGFEKAWVTYDDRDRIRIMNGSRFDGSAPINNPEHTNGSCLDFRYPLRVARSIPAIPKDIDWEHMIDLVEHWVSIRNALYPTADIKILLYDEFRDYLAAQYTVWYDDVYSSEVRFVGTTGEGGRAHKDHCHVQIIGV